MKHEGKGLYANHHVMFSHSAYHRPLKLTEEKTTPAIFIQAKLPGRPLTQQDEYFAEARQIIYMRPG